MVGQTVAHYKITDMLGEGGMGTVYRADDLKLDRTVALKFVLSSIGDQLNGHERLVREAKACAALNHPNITTIHDFGEDGSQSFIVMEFVEGVTLQEAIQQRSFEPEEIVAIGIQIADALDAAHAKGIIHRDLKSANVMLDASGRVKVMDFGLAKLAQSSFVTQSGATLGTAAYMSPEQVRGDELTPRSDIYSLGVVLYELATGVTPYPHAHQLAVMYAIANEEPLPPREHNASIPVALEAVIMKAMAKNPDERYASCARMVEALRSAAPAGGHAAIGSAVSTPLGGKSSVRGAKDQRSAGPRRALAAVADLPLLRMRWFRIGVPVVLLAGIVAVALVVKAPLLPMGGGSPQMTATTHYNTAISYWQEAQALEARDEEAQADARYRRARTSLQRAVELDSTSSTTWSLLASVNARLQEYEQAIAQNERAIRLDATNTEAHYNLGFALEEIGRPDRALQAYAEAVRLDSSFTEAYSALGNSLIEQGRMDEALGVLERALEKTPESDVLFLIRKNLGKAHLAAGRHQEAVPHLIESLQAEPDWPETTALLARAYESAGMDEEASLLWRRYLELETDAEKLAAARERLGER